MPPFRFHIPFFSTKSPSRLSSGTSSPSPPPSPSSRLSSGTTSSSPPGPPPTPPSRPPFRPAGIAQPMSNVSPSLKRVKSNVLAPAASSSTSQSPSREATPNQLAKQQSGSSLKSVESLRTEEQKLTTKEKPPGETGKVSGKIINPETQKPPSARPEEHLERKEAEIVQEQMKKTEKEKFAVQERKKALEQKSESDKEQQKRKEKEKLAVQETKRALQVVNREDATHKKTTQSLSTASEFKRDLPEKETEAQIRTEIRTDDNHQKTKGASTSKIGIPRAKSGKETSSMGRKIKEDIRDGISKLTWGKSNGDEKSVSVFTLTGENRGATMGIGSEKDKKDSEVPIRRGYKSNPEESPNTTETEEGKRPCKGKNPKDHEVEETRVKAYVNGNSQAINNSILVECSVSENDPGVHMILKFEISKKDTETPPENVPEKKPETVKATANIKNEPRVRRRCLRGLLAESSESDPENPLKPRKHGCKFTCKDKDIENS